MNKKTLFIAITTATIVALVGCNDVSVGSDKGGPAEAFLNRFDNDNPTVRQFALSVRVSHADRGSVTITPAPSPDSLYNEGATVTLEAAVTTGKPYVFAGWTGTTAAENGANPTTTITMNEPRIITANFALHPLILGERQAWVAGGANGIFGFIFDENGNFYDIERASPSSNVWTAEHGQWHIDGDGWLNLDYTGRVANRYRYEFFGANENSLMLESADGYQNTYTVTGGISIPLN